MVGDNLRPPPSRREDGMLGLLEVIKTAKVRSKKTARVPTLSASRLYTRLSCV